MGSPGYAFARRLHPLVRNFVRGRYRRVVIFSGAGVSTNSGIPDYRSRLFAIPATYSVARKMKPLELQANRELSMQQARNSTGKEFTIQQAQESRLRSSLEIDACLDGYTLTSIEPGPAHFFPVWLHDKGWLQHVFTQNVDGLYQEAGLPENKLVEFHGSLERNNVLLTGDAISTVALGRVYTQLIREPRPDLVIVMGSSLQIAPFCALPNLASRSCHRVLIDRYPEVCFENDWSRSRGIRAKDKSYVSFSPPTGVKGKRRRVTLRSYWGDGGKRWPHQYIFETEVDEWCRELMRVVDSSTD